MTDYKVAKALLNHTGFSNPIFCVMINNKISYFVYDGRIFESVSCLDVQPIEEPQDLKERRLVLESVACELAKLRKKSKLKVRDRQRIMQLTEQYPRLEDQIRNMDAIAKYLGIDQSVTPSLRERTYS